MPGHCSDQDEVNTAIMIPDIFTKTYNFDGHQYHKKDKPTLHKGDLSWSAIYRCNFYRTKYFDVNGCPGKVLPSTVQCIQVTTNDRQTPT